MPGRGGRSGNTHSGGKPPSSYLKRSAKEAGLDDATVKSLLNEQSSTLYPEFKWHSNGSMWNEEDDDELEKETPKRSSKEAFMIQKSSEIRSRMQALYRFQDSEQDVQRYHEKTSEDSLLNLSNVSVAANRLGPAYVPQELLQTPASRTAKKKAATRVPKGTTSTSTNGKNKDLHELEEMESTRRADGEEGGDEDADNVDQTTEQLSGEEEESADYTMNYYESEGEESDADGGDGGEPTF